MANPTQENQIAAPTGQSPALALDPGSAESIAHLRAEIERWRDSNCRLRDEMEHQAARANNAEWALREIAEDPANAVSYFEDKWRTIARKALGLSVPNVRDEPRLQLARHVRQHGA